LSEQLTVSHGQIEPEIGLQIDPLCSLYAQVRPPAYNRYQTNELCKDELVDWLTFNGQQTMAGRIESCGTAFIHLIDSEGFERYNRLRCKNELCPVCGSKNSSVHKRRVGRALIRLLWNGLLGSFVFTLPAEISEARPSKDKINKLTKKAWQIVKKEFETPGGLSRVHLMGDKPEKLRIHINFLFPLLNADNRGMVPKEKIETVRNLWTATLNKSFNLDLKESNFKYGFADVPGKKVNKIKYVLRPIVTAQKFLTLSDDDRHYVLSLRKGHNTRWYGNLSNAKYKKYLNERGVDVNKLENEVDGLLSPVTGEKYRFLGIVQEKDLPRHNLRWLDGDTLVDFGTFAFLQQGETATHTKPLIKSKRKVLKKPSTLNPQLTIKF